MTPGERYTNATLVRVRGTTGRAHPFCAGILIDPDTQVSFFAAPILRHLVGQDADQLRHTFKRLGWTATIRKPR